MNEYTVNDVAKTLGVSVRRIYYAHYYAGLPDPKRVGRTRIYTPKDVERVRDYFARQRAAGKGVK